VHLAPSVEIRGDLWRQKSRIPELSCGVVRVILRFAVLVELRLVTDGQTDRTMAIVPRMHSIARLKLLPPGVIFQKLKCTKFNFGCGCAPDPAGEGDSAPPDLLAGFKGPTSKGRERTKDGKEGKGRGKKGWDGTCF